MAETDSDMKASTLYLSQDAIRLIAPVRTTSMDKQRCCNCGQSFGDLDAHMRKSMPAVVLVTNRLSSCRLVQWRRTPSGMVAPTPANVSTRFIGADPEVEGVARISYNVE
jgi:hypothetical protein